MSRNRRYREDENAISPIIGVMLMVVITVVLAATIAMFSFNIAAGTKKIENAAVKVDRVNDTSIVVKFFGSMENRALLFDDTNVPAGNYGETATGAYGSFNVSVNGNEISNFVPLGAPHCTSSIGSSQYFSPVPQGSEVQVVANFKFASKSVVWEGTV
jgi:flagellin-like protein